MPRPLHDKAPQDSTAAGEPTRRSGFDRLPVELQEHLREELAATKEPGWFERYAAEVEERRGSGPKVARKR